MASDSNKIRQRVATLSDSLDDLSDKIEPLLAQSLPETVVGLETIQQAKLQVAIPYLVYDLVFIYLKTRGIDPKTHPVIAELDRIRQYFDKIKNAEDPATRTTTIDKAAAGRFIKHAITQAKNVQMQPVSNSNAPGPSGSHIRFGSDGESVRVPAKITSKMVERKQYLEDLKEQGSEEEADLEMFDEVPEEQSAGGQDAGPSPSASKNKGKGKAPCAVEDDSSPVERTGKKRRRPVMDPFQGYGSDKGEDGVSMKGASTPLADASGRDPPDSAVEQTGKSKSSKKKRKTKKPSAISKT